MTNLPMTTTMMMMMMMMTLVFGQDLPDIYYPFGTNVGDNAQCNIGDFCVVPVTVTGGFPYFGVSRSSVATCGNGVVRFENNIVAKAYAPLPSVTYIMFAIWATDLDLPSNDGCAYVREVTDSGTIADITNDIQAAFSTFLPTWVYLVTFYNVTYDGGDSTTPVNTFQAVLATDGTTSYVIYNFGPIGFSKKPGSAFEVQVGFNAGDGVNGFALPGSNSPNVVDLATTTNVNKLGRWIFCVSGVATDNQTNYAMCTTNPCLNGGTCNIGSSCSCPPGTDGHLCEIDIDACVNNPCENGATCVDDVASYSCNCASGFIGVNCADISACVSNPCENGATCVNVGASYSCNCASGFIGDNCQFVDPCASNPCKNGAVCKSLQNSFKCQCQRGFGGKTCKRKCDRNCRGSSGCDFYGPGKCDTRCVKGYKLLELTNKCRSVRCNSRLYRLENRRHCGWVNSKEKKQKKNKKNKSRRGRRRG